MRDKQLLRPIRQRENLRRKVAIIGATGMVGRRMASLLLDHPRFELGMVVGSDSRTDESYRAVWEEKEKALRRHYGDFWREFAFPEALGGMRLSSFKNLLCSDCAIVFSSLPDRAGEFEDKLISNGQQVFSNSPYRRFAPGVALVVPEVNGHELGRSQFIKNPNCVSSGLLLVLAPLHARYGIREVVVTTYQSLSGRGDAKYASDLVVGNVYPLHRSSEGTEQYVRREVGRILGESVPVSVTCNRICVQEGHFVEVRIRTKQPVPSASEAEELLANFDPLGSLGLHSSPEKPIVIVRETGRPRPMQDAYHHGGMAIGVGNLSVEDEVFDLRLTYVVNNLVRGAAGGVLLNAELWDANLHSDSVEKSENSPYA
ncbi:MAG TPA: Asd/ArgC dimerization domain-containing protein, partial [Candidatus Angelobacter sp.]